MKIPKITDENVYIFLPLKVIEVAEMAAKDRKTSSLDEMLKFYKSDTYRKLEQEKTKLWWESPLSIYERYRQEKLPILKNE
ncbi:MAG: hypothetical protein ACRCUS_08385 [Anaerovoracaceae bacterium]